ncbi:3-oxoacyl-[acyl-carrier-protein] reductase [Bartonella sp. TP]|uniref:3-oxoacyl-[acyl-carrier-protein] reductase n=1 Tax=Bartonella sp. TP TaxID=3057550 RepID=UPI0025B0294B|nr:3-oxoacyl-[acyl-carrier-protein] reductase [Bartonella sp. TP]WJW80123.1 3-oxoacyl-[acyl-carrier-protein] reductase [Bartonella sp. TP]
MFDLTGKKVLITGATGGIGQALAKNFYSQGCIVGLHGSNEEKLNNLTNSLTQIGSITDRQVFTFAADLADRVATKEFATKALQDMGGVDILINNAGITRDGLFIRMSDKDFDDIIAVNLSAVFSLTQEISRSMLKQRFGRIINITSVVAVTGNPGQTNYCATKAGLIGFSKALARELATKNVTVNCIAPGFIESAMTEKLNDKQKEGILASIPMKRMGMPIDIAAAAIFLASTEAAYITGQTIHVNGGMAML